MSGLVVPIQWFQHDIWVFQHHRELVSKCCALNDGTTNAFGTSFLLLCFVLSISSQCFRLKTQGPLLFAKLLLSFVLGSVLLFLVEEPSCWESEREKVSSLDELMDSVWAQLKCISNAINKWTSWKPYNARIPSVHLKYNNNFIQYDNIFQNGIKGFKGIM